MGKGLKIMLACALLGAAPAWAGPPMSPGVQSQADTQSPPAAQSPTAAQSPPAEVPGASAQDLLQWLERDSPELQAAQHDAASAADGADAAGVLPDPSVRIEWWDIPNNNPTLDPRADGMTMYKLIQPIPGWGKLDAQKRAAEAGADAARARQRAVRADLRTQVKLAYARYYRAFHALQLNQELAAFADSVAQLARSRYETGLASQQEMIRAQLEQSGLQTERYALQADLSQSQAAINALLDRPARAPLQDPAALRPLPPPAVLNEDALMQRLRDASPVLAGEAAQVRGAQSSADLARRNKRPDFMVGIGPTQRGGSFSTFGAMLEFTVPLHSEARGAQQREAEEAAEAGRARLRAAQARLAGELRQRYAALEAAGQQEALDSQRALPLAELAFKGALAGYRNGNVDFATLLEAKRQVQKARLDELDAQVAQQVNLAGIEQLIGEDL